jgi:transglutaminase-like putative cysteine protease
VIDWRIDVSADTKLVGHEDAFGNFTHVFTADGPLEELRITVDGDVETQDTDGLIRGAVERFPPSLFLRDTSLTQADPAISNFAQQARAASGGETLAGLHALLRRLHDEIASGDVALEAGPSAAEAFARKCGVAQDWTHVFIGAARSQGIPARYVAGYFCAAEDATRERDYAWAEAFVPDLGWVGFDPTKGACPTEAYVRVAIGLDAHGAALVRGRRYGPGDETLEVVVKTDLKTDQ